MILHNKQDAIEQMVGAGYLRNPGNGKPPKLDFDGGNRYFSYYYHPEHEAGYSYKMSFADALSDPESWQALGKVRGWHDGLLLRKYTSPEGAIEDTVSLINYHALRYFETRFSNGDMKAYWESLP